MRLVRAIAVAPFAPSPTRQSPPCYVADDGNAYWLKGNPTAAGEFTLVAELIAGRLGESLRVAPPVAVVEVPGAALEARDSSLEGYCFGSRHQPGMLNVKELSAMRLPVPIEFLSPAQAAKVQAFQSWIGLVDWQCLVSVDGGDVMLSIDHEVWSIGDMSAEVALIPFQRGLETIKYTQEDINRALQSIRDVDDDNIEAFCRDMPDDHRFWAPDDLLVRTSAMLIERKHNLERLAETWQPS